MAAATAADVPGKYDVVINGFGYIVWNALDPNMPFRWQKAQVSYSPTFVERSNVGDTYGDEQQSFWLTASQNDWTEGEGQRFFRGKDPDSKRKYWLGSALDLTVPGQVTLNSAVVTNAALAGTVTVAFPDRLSGLQAAFATSTNLYTITKTGAVTDRGAHGLGAAPTAGCSDGANDYLSTTAAGTVGVRRWTGSAFSTFSATGCDALAFLNNTLYGFSNATRSLIQYDSAGVATTLFTWRDATATALAVTAHLAAFGGQLLILLSSDTALPNGPELWLYNGTTTARLAQLGNGTRVRTTTQQCPLAVLNGIVFIGLEKTRTNSAGSTESKAAVFYYANGTIGLLYEPDDWVTGQPALAAFGGKLLIAPQSAADYKLYTGETGSVHSVGTTSGLGINNASITHAVAAVDFVVVFAASKASVLWGDTGLASTHTAASGKLITSLFDFDSSLPKLVCCVVPVFDLGADGNGGSVDVGYYTIDPQTVTSLGTGVTSGVEVQFPANTKLQSVGVVVTLNKGTSSLGPTLKRIFLRASPVLKAFRQGDYIIDCTGYQGRAPVRLRDGSESALSGLQLAKNLATAATSTTPFSITDEFGTFTGIIEPDKFELDKIRPGEYIARVAVREI